VAFDHIAVDDGRVARLRTRRDSVLCFDRSDVVGFGDLRPETVLLQVLHPIGAAAARRRLIYLHRGCGPLRPSRSD
jgi:hypothetical protein